MAATMGVVMSDDAEMLAEALDEEKWNASFAKSHNNLIAAAKKAKEEIARGLAMPLDPDQLEIMIAPNDCSSSQKRK